MPHIARLTQSSLLTERAARLPVLPAGALHSQRNDGWTEHSILGQFFFTSCSIWMVRRDLLVAAVATWSRARHFGNGQQPLRSRAEPFGLQSLDPLSISKVTALNQQLVFVSWFLKEALMCPTKKVGVILVFPEDLGGLLDSGAT